MVRSIDMGLFKKIGTIFKKKERAPARNIQVLEEMKVEEPVIDLDYKFKVSCDCEKDFKYQFACKEGVKWFTNKEIVTKIRRKHKLQPLTPVYTVINDEYQKCKEVYKSLKKLVPKQETVL